MTKEVQLVNEIVFHFMQKRGGKGDHKNGHVPLNRASVVRSHSCGYHSDATDKDDCSYEGLALS